MQFKMKIALSGEGVLSAITLIHKKVRFTVILVHAKLPSRAIRK